MAQSGHLQSIQSEFEGIYVGKLLNFCIDTLLLLCFEISRPNRKTAKFQNPIGKSNRIENQNRLTSTANT